MKANISNKVKNLLKEIKNEYSVGTVCMGELLADFTVNDITIEEAYELYMLAQNYANGDMFYTILGDDTETIVNCLDNDDKHTVKMMKQG